MPCKVLDKYVTLLSNRQTDGTLKEKSCRRKRDHNTAIPDATNVMTEAATLPNATLPNATKLMTMTSPTKAAPADDNTTTTKLMTMTSPTKAAPADDDTTTIKLMYISKSIFILFLFLRRLVTSREWMRTHGTLNECGGFVCGLV